MSMSDSLKFMGLGIIIAKARFRVRVQSQETGFGFIRKWYIHIDNLHEGEMKLVKLWADDNDLRFKTNRLYKTDDIIAWIDALEPYRELLHDQRGLERLEWVMDNPMPMYAMVNQTWEDFIAWAEEWDKFNEGLS